MIVEENKMLYSITAIGKINDILVYFSLLSAHLSIVIESFIRRAYFDDYWNFYDKIVKLNSKSINMKWYKGYLIKFMIYMCLTITIEILVITNIAENDEQWTNFWYAQIYSLMMTRVRHIQHVFFIDAIYFTLQSINEHLRNLTLWTQAVDCDSTKKFPQRNFHAKFNAIKYQFKYLMQMIICVNKIFCWSQVFNVGQHFIEITSELYWIYAFAKSSNFLYGKQNCNWKLKKFLFIYLFFILAGDPSNFTMLYSERGCNNFAHESGNKVHKRGERL
jgi:hypothetical protein